MNTRVYIDTTMMAWCIVCMYMTFFTYLCVYVFVWVTSCLYPSQRHLQVSPLLPSIDSVFGYSISVAIHGTPLKVCINMASCQRLCPCSHPHSQYTATDTAQSLHRQRNRDARLISVSLGGFDCRGPATSTTYPLHSLDYNLIPFSISVSHFLHIHTPR